MGGTGNFFAVEGHQYIVHQQAALFGCAAGLDAHYLYAGHVIVHVEGEGVIAVVVVAVAQ